MGKVSVQVEPAKKPFLAQQSAYPSSRRTDATLLCGVIALQTLGGGILPPAALSSEITRGKDESVEREGAAAQIW